MIISTETELSAILPTQVMESPASLFTLIGQTEKTYIIPLLGALLYKEVCDAYADIRQGRATITPEQLVASFADTEGFPPEYTPMQQLIRLLQPPIVYMTLANNAALLSVSLNAAGMNVASAEGYDPVDTKTREAFARDCFLNAHKGIELVLLFLEEDARSDEPVFLERWRSSASFFQQNGLLIRTADELNRYVNINNSRETYLALVPRLRFFQDTYLRPDFGDTLINALLQFQLYGPQPVADTEQPDAEVPGQTEAAEGSQPWQVITTEQQSDDAFFTDLRPHLPRRLTGDSVAEEARRLHVWNRLLSYLRPALAYLAEAEKKGAETHFLNDANLCLERARLLVRGNPNLFQGVVEDSPLYTPPVISQPSTETPEADTLSSSPSQGGVHDPFDLF